MVFSKAVRKKKKLYNKIKFWNERVLKGEQESRRHFPKKDLLELIEYWLVRFFPIVPWKYYWGDSFESSFFRIS